MLYESLLLLENQLNEYFDKLRAKDPSNIVKSPVAKLDSIVSFEESELKTKENIFISLVNVSEEVTLKNVPNYRKEGTSTVYQNPPVFLNLYILFCAVMPQGKYDVALLHLSHLIKFFQSKNVFTIKNSFSLANALKTTNYKLILDLYSPTFEQANYLWSTLGGKQHPYVLYKLRLVEMEMESDTEERGVITQINLNEARL